jgi:hypothetical protein
MPEVERGLVMTGGLVMIDGASTLGFEPLAGMIPWDGGWNRNGGRFPFGVGFAAGAPGIGEIVGT